mgnify:CR=1 FL=1
MGIVAAQCRVFIAQNDICAPRPLYYHLFSIDYRRVPARSPPRRLLDSLPLPSIPPAFHAPVSPRFALRSVLRAAKRAAPPPFSPFAGVPSLPFGCPLCRSRSIPSRFLVRFFVSSCRPRSRNRNGRDVPYRSMPYAPYRRFVPRPVFLRAGRRVSSVVSRGGEDGGEFYGMFHMKRDTSPCVFRCLPAPSASPVGCVGRSRPMPVCGSVPSSCLAVRIRMRGWEVFSVFYRLA